jgi:probable HAF family extracellular repeat protein
MAVDGRTVVGESDLPGDQSKHAFAYDIRSKKIRDLGTLGGVNSSARDVDGSIVVGSSMTGVGATSHAFAVDLTDGVMKDLGTLGGPNSEAMAVYGRTVVGYSEHALPGYRAFAYDLDTGLMEDIGSLGACDHAAYGVDQDYIVGQGCIGSNEATRGFLYDRSTGLMLDVGTLGGTHSYAQDVSGGFVVGQATTDPGPINYYQAYIYDIASHTMTNIGGLPGNGWMNSAASAISGDKVVGASYYGSSYASHGFVYSRASQAMKDLGVLGGTASYAQDVDGDFIVGASTTANNTGYRPVLWTLVPSHKRHA